MGNSTHEMYIAQCNICTLAPAMRVCKVCPFKAGREYWLCNCTSDRVRHKSELFCVRCDTDSPSHLKPVLSKEQLERQRWLYELFE